MMDQSHSWRVQEAVRSSLKYRPISITSVLVAVFVHRLEIGLNSTRYDIVHMYVSVHADLRVALRQGSSDVYVAAAFRTRWLSWLLPHTPKNLGLRVVSAQSIS